jgi:hypothetical protein
MNQEELNKIIENHQHWLNMDCEGWENMRANLAGADLERADLREANLADANLTNANLTNGYFTGVNLAYADLTNANLREANLTYANATNANFTRAVFERARLTCANFADANLRGANLRGACLRKANFANVDLVDANFADVDFIDANFTGANLACVNLVDAFNIPMTCPTEGSFIGWKKAHVKTNKVIVKLLIPEDARRSSATSRKCRCDKAKVLSIESLDKETQYDSAKSSYDSKFVYEVGKEVSVPDFCEDRFKECAAGIHFFINREEAVRY